MRANTLREKRPIHLIIVRQKDIVDADYHAARQLRQDLAENTVISGIPA
jgi:hypothetical protein